MRQKSSRHLATTVDLEHVTTYNQINPEQNRPVIGEIAHSNSEPWLNLQNNNQWYMSDSIGSKWSKLWTLAIMVAVLLVLPSSHIRYLACPEIRNPSNWSARASCSSLFLSTRPPLVSLIADFPAVYWSIFPCWLTMSQGLLAVSPSLKIPMDPHVVCSSMLQPPCLKVTSRIIFSATALLSAVAAKAQHLAHGGSTPGFSTLLGVWSPHTPCRAHACSWRKWVGSLEDQNRFLA